jgi:NAD(P)-dependent dehydrogenase (short-subunit alcohol dehydrogenase family)
MSDRNELRGRTALVVGASRGIGAEIARELARRGAQVVLGARSTAALHAVRDEITAEGHVAHAVSVDATRPSSINAAVERARSLAGPIDILVYASGASTVGRFDDLGDDTWTHLYELNVLGAVRFTRALLPDMRERRWGRVIFIASTAAKHGSLYQAPYNATKHALLGMVKCVALETARTGVTVNAVCPGFVDTDMVGEAIPQWAELLNVPEDQIVDTVVSRVPMRRMLQPEEVAAMACYVASPKAAGLTGQGLTLDGGLILI